MSNETTSKRDGGLIAFFVLTYLITWGLAAFLFLLPGLCDALFGKMSMPSPVFVVAVAAHTTSATILTYICSRRLGLRCLHARLVRWKFGLQWYALVLIGMPFIGYLVGQLSGDQPSGDLSTPVLVMSFLMGQLILGTISGVWHLPSFFVSSLVQSSLAIPVFLFGALSMSVLATWFYLHTGGSVLVSVLFHLAFNASLNAFGASFTWFTLALALCALLVVVLDRHLGWLRPVTGPAAPIAGS